jgi:hypothetical protein
LEVSNLKLLQDYKKTEELNLKLDNSKPLDHIDLTKNLLKDLIILNFKNENFLLENKDLQKNYLAIKEYLDRVEHVMPNFTFFEF